MKIFDTIKLIKFLMAVIFTLTSSTIIKADVPKQKAHTGIIFYQDSSFVEDRISYSVFVLKTIPGSSASKTDIQSKDKLININGIKGGNMKKDIEKVNQLMEGEENTSISIELERSEPNKPIKRITYVLERTITDKSIKQKVFGIGVTLSADSIIIKDKKTYFAKIQIVYPGSPAEMAGIKSGDCIIVVDGFRIDSSAIDVLPQVIQHLLIDEPKEAKLVLLRKLNDSDTRININLTRTDISKYIQIGQLVPVNPAETQKTETVSPDKIPMITENDTDGDGIENKSDACPDVKGIYSINPYLNGCPENK